MSLITPCHSSQECQAFFLQSKTLRETIDRTGRAYASALDLIVHGASVPYNSDSYALALEEGDSLEHFHLFNQPAATAAADIGASTPHASKFEALAEMKQNGHDSHDSSVSESNPTLVMHSDIGLFIVMTQASYFRYCSS